MSAINYQGFPKLDAPIIDENGFISIPWYRLLMTLWQKSGGSFTQLPNSQVLEVAPDGSTMIVNSATGETSGSVITSENVTENIISTAIIAPPGDFFGNANPVNNSLMLQAPF